MNMIIAPTGCAVRISRYKNAILKNYGSYFFTSNVVHKFKKNQFFDTAKDYNIERVS